MMKPSKTFIFNRPKSQFANGLKILFAVAAFIEIIGEYFADIAVVSCSKPLLMPILIAIYLLESKSKKSLYILALLAVWAGNIFLISKSFECLIIGTSCFTLFRILIIWQIIKSSRIPGIMPIIIGCMPFLFIYLFTINLAYDGLGDNIYVFALQGIFAIIFGGIALGNYIFKSDSANTYLLMSMMFFTSTQFLFVVKHFYVAIGIFQPILMVLFVIAHFLLYKYMISKENETADT